MPRWFAGAAVSAFATLALAAPAPADVLGPPVPFTVGNGPQALASGDFNRDGITDLVTANNAGQTASVLAGLPTGGFAAPISVPVSALPRAVAVADFNGDGDQDLAIATVGFAASIALGGPGATFGVPTDFPALGNPVDLETADVNGDGDPDLVVTNPIMGRVLLGGAGGTFTSGPLMSLLGFNAVSVAVGDFDQDLAPDLAFADSNGTTPRIGVWRGAGDGTFTAAGAVSAVPPPRVLVPADVNGDGDLDLIAGGTGEVAVFYGGAATTFPSRVSAAVPGASASVAVRDLNGDGDLDIVNGAGNGTLALVLGGPGDTLLPAPPIDIGGQLSGVVAVRLNGDDRPDVAVTSQDTNTVSVLQNTSVAAIETNPANLTFPTQARGTLSAARTVTVSSTGERRLHIRAIRTIGLAKDSYVVTGDACSGETLPAGGTCTFAVRFAPENAGAHEADLHILSDAASNPIFAMVLNGTGGALPSGATGATGATGPPGRTGAATVRDRLVAAFASDRARVRAGKRLRVRFVSTIAGVATLELRRGTRGLRRVSVATKAGRNTLSIQAPRKRGRYTLALTVTGGGQTVTDAARLTVVRRPT